MNHRTRTLLAGVALACGIAVAATPPVSGAGSGAATGATHAARVTAAAPRNGRIFFSTGFILPQPDLSGNWQVYSVRPDGSDLEQLTHVPAGVVAGDPGVSPDGRTVAYVTNTTGAFTVWTMSRTGRHERRLLATPRTDYFLPSWSPDGKRLLLTACDTSLGFEAWCDLVTVRADGSHLRKVVADHRNNFAGHYSPNGRWIEFGSDRSGYVGAIWVIRASGGRPHRLTPPRLEAETAAWSPDGSHIAFGSNCCQPDGNIYTVTRDGGHLTKLTHAPFPHGAGWPSYSPDGRYIAFGSDMLRPEGSPKLDLFVMRADGSHVRRIESEEQPTPILDWAPAPTASPSEGVLP